METDDKIWETETVKLIGITTNSELNFDEHLNNVCLKVNRKLSAVMRIRKFLHFNQTRMLFKGFFESQFKYCPLAWMFYSRHTSNEINLLHRRVIKLVYNDYGLPYEKLFKKTVPLLSITIVFRHCASNYTKYIIT